MSNQRELRAAAGLKKTIADLEAENKRLKAELAKYETAAKPGEVAVDAVEEAQEAFYRNENPGIRWG